MDAEAVRKLEELRADHAAVTGSAFEHFYCPFLFRDEPAELCKAHLVSRAYGGSPKDWTIQRKDIDNFYGSVFESSFVQLQHRGKRTPDEYLTDKELARHLKPQFEIDGRAIGHYIARGPVPSSFSEVAVEGPKGEVRIALKIEPQALLAAAESKMEVVVSADLRLQALGSLLKAAHLTVFEMLGYRYAYSAGGHLLGHDVLGRFFSANRGLSHRNVLNNALSHFSEFANMVRPVMSGTTNLEGTASDRRVFACTTATNKTWALAVFVRTGDDLHAVLVPVFEDPDSAARFMAFLRQPRNYVEVHVAKFEGERWLFAKEGRMIEWPAVDMS